MTVAIPVRDGGPLLDEVLAAVRAQQLDAQIELLVCDSGSRDASVQIAKRHGAEVFEIAPPSSRPCSSLKRARMRSNHGSFSPMKYVP